MEGMGGEESLRDVDQAKMVIARRRSMGKMALLMQPKAFRHGTDQQWAKAGACSNDTQRMTTDQQGCKSKCKDAVRVLL